MLLVFKLSTIYLEPLGKPDMILTKIIKELLPSTWNNLLNRGFNFLLILVASPSSKRSDARTKKGKIEGNSLVLKVNKNT